jgi:DNA ligase-associated metallophosphoesterase
MSNPVHIILADQPVHLYAQRGLYLPRTGTLLVTDTHWGKAETFRRSAIPIPYGDLADDLKRLDSLIAATRPQRLIVLGDLVHAARGYEPVMTSEIGAWRARHPELDMLLVRGNHDGHAGDPPRAWGIELHDAPYVMPPFVLTHYPARHDAGYVLSGHLHPAVQMMGKARQTLKLPCFWLQMDHAVLPAFGGFIAHMTIRPRSGDRVYVVTDESVFAV